jgi:hypothetical protein
MHQNPVRTFRVPDELWNRLKEEKGNMEWDEFLNKMLNKAVQYEREKPALDKKQTALADAVVGAQFAKQQLESVVPSDLVRNRDEWKRRAEEAEKKLKDLRDMI